MSGERDGSLWTDLVAKVLRGSSCGDFLLLRFGVCPELEHTLLTNGTPSVLGDGLTALNNVECSVRFFDRGRWDGVQQLLCIRC